MKHARGSESICVYPCGPVEILERLVCSPSYYHSWFPPVGSMSRMCASLLREIVSWKAYHDASLFSLYLIDTVPRALIVFAVLFSHSAVSLLDRHMRFDYPERESAGTLFETNAFRAVVNRSLLRGAGVSFEQWVFSFLVPDWISPRKPPFGHYVCSAAATIVGFVTSEVTW
jgi:hypothetical protein